MMQCDSGYTKVQPAACNWQSRLYDYQSFLDFITAIYSTLFVAVLLLGSIIRGSPSNRRPPHE